MGETLGYAVHAMGLSANTATTEGSSVGGRLFYVPFADEGNALHLGLSYSIDDEDTGSLPAAATHNVVAPYAGRRGPSINLGNAGAAATAASTDNAQSTFAIEAAYAFGPVTLQTEYAMAKLDNTHVVNGTPTDSDATSFYLQGSWFVTGEKTQYRKDRGAFQKPKSYNSANGAWEVVARYEMAENKDQSLTENTTGTAGSKAEASVFVLGANWYLNPSMRFMLNYYTGEADRGVASAAPGSPERKDKPKAITLRTQLSF